MKGNYLVDNKQEVDIEAIQGQAIDSRSGSHGNNLTIKSILLIYCIDYNRADSCALLRFHSEIKQN